MTTVDFGSGGRRVVGPHYVYFRRRWTDSWTLYSEVDCTEAVWTVAPSINTATLTYDYGATKGLTSPAFSYSAPLDVQRWYVRVVFTTNTVTGEQANWYGVVSDVDDANGGLITLGGTTYASGRQTLYCHGMEKLLAMNDIRHSWVMNTATDGTTSEMKVDLPIAFNAYGKPNRGRTKYGDTYLFDNGPFWLSSTLPDTDWWSTADIVEYLLTRLSPEGAADTDLQEVPFRIDAGDLTTLDGNDRPTVRQEGSTVLSLLYQLIDRRRMRSFYWDVTGGIGRDYVWLKPFTFTEADITLEAGDTIQQNTTQKAVIYDSDELTVAVDRQADTKKYDQIIARGARRRSVCTMYWEADRFENGWTSTQESTYEAGSSGATGYAGWDDRTKQTRNAETRSVPTLEPVYRWFAIPDDWDGTAGYSTTDREVFLDDSDSGVDQYIHEVVIEDTLPLLEGVDYSTDLTSVTTPKHQREMQPFAVFKRPGTSIYVRGTDIAQTADGAPDDGDGDNPRWSATVNPQKLGKESDGRILEVNVVGEPQHVIAYTDFSGLTEDRDVGQWDYKDKKMLVTMALRDNRYAEGKWPEDVNVDDDNIDAMRRRVLYVGDEYLQDYVAADTVVDVDDDGGLVICNGGYINDDTDRLEDIAKIAYHWYSVDRNVIQITSYRLTNQLAVGTLITTVGDGTVTGNAHYQTVNSVVTEVRFSTPRLESGDLQQPLMHITTSCGEVDFAAMVPPKPHGVGKLPITQFRSSYSGEGRMIRVTR